MSLQNVEIVKDAKTDRDKYKSFRLRILRDEKSGHEERKLEFHAEKLLHFLRSHVNIEDIYDDLPQIDTYVVFNYLDTIKRRAQQHGQMTVVKELVSFLEEENRVTLNTIKNMLAQGQMSFGLCKTLFCEGTEVEIHGDDVMGAVVVDTAYRHTMFGSYLQITYEYIGTDGQHCMQMRDNVRLNAWNGVKEITTLPIRPISADVKANLFKRGEMFARIATGAHYMQYQGQMQVKKWWNWDSMRADGRIMTDPGTYSQFVDEYDNDDDDGNQLAEINPEQLWMTDPYIKGFSFTTKQWGRFAVSRITDIQYRDNAFDQLVLAEDKKDLVRALVTHGTGGFSDIISGKGGGCIFLLHGDPGVGKTLTAEAISELLHRPLYSVAVGELGTNTEQLEKSLRQILDVAQIWNAVVLIDEADIFLEKRTSGDILRNACVGIFLKLLEYHQGVLFLTTNRVTEFDSAFYSRISIALKYEALSKDAREKIWRNLLAVAGIKGLDPAELSLNEINGRQIKNTIRLAQGLAAQQGVPVSAKHIEMTLSVSQQFQKDLKEG